PPRPGDAVLLGKHSGETLTSAPSPGSARTHAPTDTITATPEQRIVISRIGLPPCDGRTAPGRLPLCPEPGRSL
ncbi:MAG: hypothetical protein LC713_02030, partial [Actinobacteria bacterium]|nr:hypothetical protein [Actinomycetota bacterium]